VVQPRRPLSAAAIGSSTVSGILTIWVDTIVAVQSSLMAEDCGLTRRWNQFITS